MPVTSVYGSQHLLLHYIPGYMENHPRMFTVSRGNLESSSHVSVDINSIVLRLEWLSWYQINIYRLHVHNNYFVYLTSPISSWFYPFYKFWIYFLLLFSTFITTHFIIYFLNAGHTFLAIDKFMYPRFLNSYRFLLVVQKTNNTASITLSVTALELCDPSYVAKK